MAITTSSAMSFARTEISGDGLSVNWLESDMLGVYMEYDDDIKSIEPYSTNAAGISGNTAVFSGGHNWQAPSSSHKFYAYYPYSTLTVVPAPTVVSVSLPSVQTQAGASSSHIGELDFALTGPVEVQSPASVGTAGSVVMTFRHAFALVEGQGVIGE